MFQAQLIVIINCMYNDSNVPDQRLVLAYYNYLDPTHSYYFRDCSEFTGHNRPQDLCDFDLWHSLRFVDVKIDSVFFNQSMDVQQRLWADVNKFLSNGQRIKCLHFSMDTADHVQHLKNLQYSDAVVIELHVNVVSNNLAIWREKMLQYLDSQHIAMMLLLYKQHTVQVVKHMDTHQLFHILDTATVK